MIYDCVCRFCPSDRPWRLRRLFAAWRLNSMAGFAKAIALLLYFLFPLLDAKAWDRRWQRCNTLQWIWQYARPVDVQVGSQTRWCYGQRPRQRCRACGSESTESTESSTTLVKRWFVCSFVPLWNMMGLNQAVYFSWSLFSIITKTWGFSIKEVKRMSKRCQRGHTEGETCTEKKCCVLLLRSSWTVSECVWLGEAGSDKWWGAQVFDQSIQWRELSMQINHNIAYITRHSTII